MNHTTLEEAQERRCIACMFEELQVPVKVPKDASATQRQIFKSIEKTRQTLLKGFAAWYTKEDMQHTCKNEAEA